MTDYEVALRLERVRWSLDTAYQFARSSGSRHAIIIADKALKTLKVELGHPRAGLAGDESAPGKPLGDIRCQR